ncbi:hypothetical protein ANCCAN_07673 [Ancylostoma caninum]|uniref:Uncharacterized protein n=1 Tax=Ancylostoma caninum TaxID=29170 RepID=A0A368GPH7_ANCCA|nr:hypothetical protein ANCCAN_07673 [Ancylostoma caninum]
MNNWISAFLLFAVTKAGERKTSNDPLEDWMFTELKQCDKPPPVHEGYGCTSYLWNYELINLELFNSDPAIIVYRGLVPKNHIKSFITDITGAQKKARADSNGPRHADEITMDHTAKAGAARVFRRLSRFIPFIDFTASDPWQVLVFKEGGHFAPRHEYLKINASSEQDELTKTFGNRFATFMILLKEPGKGGDQM